MDTIDIKSSAEVCGNRLKRLRLLAGLSRKKMEKEHNISASTLQSWEDGKAGGLTLKGAKRVIKALEEEGVRCSADWLLHGIGAAPLVADKVYTGRAAQGLNEEEMGTSGASGRNTRVAEAMPDDAAISKELLAFRHANTDAVDMLVVGDEMAPVYLDGDYVAGRRHYKDKEIEQTIGLDCIVVTNDGEVLFRHVRKGSRSGVYTLICTNYKTTNSSPVLYDVELQSSAPVFFHRRKDPLRA